KEGDFKLLPSASSVAISGNSEWLASEIEEIVVQAKTDFIAGKSLEENNYNSLVFNLESDISELGAEGYILEISEDQIEIEAATKEGLWYGVITLGQLVQDALDQNAALPL